MRARLRTMVFALTATGATHGLVAQQLPANPSAIQVPPGYEVQVVAQGLDYPTDITFGPRGEIYVSEAGGHTYGTKPEEAPEARILQILPNGEHRVVYQKTVPMEVLRRTKFGKPVPAEGIVPPLVGVTFNPRNGLLYVASRQRYATLNPQTGEWRAIIDGLPSWGEFLNTKPIFDRNGRMWFVQSSQGNSGTIETHWIKLVDIFNKPDAREIPCEDVTVTGVDYFVKDKLETLFPGQDSIRAEVYVPLGVNTQPGQTLEGQFWCNGAVYRTNADGSNPERVAWGFRSVFGLRFSPAGRLIVTQNSGNIMTPRPIYDDWETILEVQEGRWFGWPDYYSGLPITDNRFRRPNDPEWKGSPEDHRFALTEETRAELLRGGQPPQPLVRIEPHAATQGFVFGKPEWGMDPESELLVAEWGAIIPY
jgi:glucose/arabinose dehydrogenase